MCMEWAFFNRNFIFSLVYFSLNRLALFGGHHGQTSGKMGKIVNVHTCQGSQDWDNAEIQVYYYLKLFGTIKQFSK